MNYFAYFRLTFLLNLTTNNGNTTYPTQNLWNSWNESDASPDIYRDDLAQLYEVETRALNQAVKRNIERFPDDLLFLLTDGEENSLR